MVMAFAKSHFGPYLSYWAISRLLGYHWCWWPNTLIITLANARVIIKSVRSSAPVVSRCFPGGYNVKLYISRGRLAWWLLAFFAKCCWHGNWPLNNERGRETRTDKGTSSLCHLCDTRESPFFSLSLRYPCFVLFAWTRTIIKITNYVGYLLVLL